MAEALRGKLVYKGERGYSAYEVALLNGFIGTEQDWLATLGTSSHFKEDKVTYTATSGQLRFALPNQYSSNSFVDVYVNGLRLNTDEYTLDKEAREIVRKYSSVADSKVEIVVLTMSTNSLPIVTTINDEGTDDTAPSTKAVYNLSETINKNITNNVNTLNTKINNVTTNANSKLPSSNIQVVTGVVNNIGSGATITKDIAYPTGFDQSNTVVISKMVSSNNNYYDMSDETVTASGFPMIRMIALTESNIRVWIKNTNASEARNGYYKITLLKTP